MKFYEMMDVFEKIRYQMSNGEQLNFTIHCDDFDHWNTSDIYLQLHAYLADNDTGVKSLQAGRKWKLSVHMTPTEIVRTAWKAVQAFEFHEMEERFKYKGKAIYNSHINVDELAEIADRVEVRV